MESETLVDHRGCRPQPEDVEPGLRKVSEPRQVDSQGAGGETPSNPSESGAEVRRYGPGKAEREQCDRDGGCTLSNGTSRLRTWLKPGRKAVKPKARKAAPA